LPGSQSVKQSLLGLAEKKKFPDYDPAKARVKRTQAIADMVDRFEEALTRIDQFIQDQLPESERTGPSPGAKSGNRVLDALVGAADVLFEGLVDSTKAKNADSTDALNVIL
jgi:hypothetical protein